MGVRVMGALAAAGALGVTGMGWTGYHNVAGGITVSQALVGGPASSGGAQNILIMGLDSRLDQHGQPLPQDIYDALHAGDESNGGYNANVLIVVHLPAGGGPVTAISIPRDDYVDLSGCPMANQECKGKVKEAYGIAYQHYLDTADARTSKSGSTTTRSGDPAGPEQAAREAGRKAEIATVRHLLGIPIDHFLEVTLVAFFQIARAVQPITVCLNADTADDFSGADFHQGSQQIDAAEAMAFVRQRRDLNDELFTDLDRTRRQQAFIASLVAALRTGGALDNPSTLHNLLDVAKQNVAVDAGFDLAGFVQHTSKMTGSPLSLYTLPITEFGQNPDGEDVNIIDVPTVRAIVANLISTGTPTLTPGGGPPTATVDKMRASAGGTTTLNVTNATDHAGLAAAVEHTFVAHGFSPGHVGTADTITDTSNIAYGPGAQAAAQALADQLNLTATATDTVGPHTVQLMIGTDFPATDYLTGDAETPTAATTSTTAPTTVSATATGMAAPAPTDLSRMTGNGVPCVK
jgi:LCP family protein required for cell wall assembly